MLRPAGPKVKARRDEVKFFWVGASWRSPNGEVERRVAPTLNGTPRPEGPGPRATHYMLRPAGPKVKARRAEAKFWVWLICGATVAS